MHQSARAYQSGSVVGFIIISVVLVGLLAASVYGARHYLAGTNTPSTETTSTPEPQPTPQPQNETPEPTEPQPAPTPAPQPTPAPAPTPTPVVPSSPSLPGTATPAVIPQTGPSDDILAFAMFAVLVAITGIYLRSYKTLVRL